MSAVAEVEDKETQLKWKLAEALLRNPTNPFKAALTVTLGDNVAALTILDSWQNTPEIHRMKQTLVEEQGEDAFLPSEATMVWGVLNRAERCIDDADYCKLMGLAADIRGINKSKSTGPAVVVNNLTNNKTMNIPVMINPSGEVLSDEEWEQSLIGQQQRLVNGV